MLHNIFILLQEIIFLQSHISIIFNNLYLKQSASDLHKSLVTASYIKLGLSDIIEYRDLQDRHGLKNGYQNIIETITINYRL